MSELNEHCQCDYCSGFDCGADNPEEVERLREEHDAAITRKAREEFADKVIAFCKSNDCVQSTYGNCDCVSTTDTECVICCVESLRAQQGGVSE